MSSLITNQPLNSIEGAVLTASLASAVLYQSLVNSPPTIPRLIIKTASTSLLSLTTHLRSGPPLLVAALGLGSLGDAFLAWSETGETSFLFGLSSFLVAHILYIVLFFQSDPGAGDAAEKFMLFLTYSQLRTWLAGCLAGAVPGMIGLLWPKLENQKALRIPVTVYSFIILGMGTMAMTVESWKVVLGAVMFTASDSILAAGKFLVAKEKGNEGLRSVMGHAVWVLYYGGQLLIAFGVLGL